MYSHHSVSLAGISSDCNLKLPWIQSVIRNGTKKLNVIRDPRLWVAHVLNDDLFNDVKDSVMEDLHSTKRLFKKNHAWQYESVRNITERMMSDDDFVDPVLSQVTYGMQAPSQLYTT